MLLNMNSTFFAKFLIFSLLLCAACTPPRENLNPEPSLSKNQVKSERTNPEALKHFMDGQFHFNQGNYSMAALEFQEALEIDPDAAPIYNSLAESYWNLGKYEKARDNLYKALKIDPDDKQSLEMLANQFILEKDYASAKPLFEKLINLYPDNSSYYAALAELELINNEISAAIAYYREAFLRSQNRIHYLETAGIIALKNKHIETAENIYAKLVSLKPEHLPYLNKYIDIVIFSKHESEAKLFLEELYNQNLSNPHLLANVALLDYETKNFEEALLSLKKVLVSAPDNSDYMTLIIDIFMESGANDSAAWYSDLYITKFPEDSRGYVNRALAHMNDGEEKMAIKVLLPVLENFSENFSIQYLLGLNYYRLKNYDQAHIYFLNALEIKPEAKQVKHSLALLYDARKMWSKSDMLYEELIKNDSTDAQALNNYAYSLAERKYNLQYALEMSKKALKIDADNSAYLDTIGWIYSKLSENNLAREFITRSIDIDKKNAVVLEHLGDVLTQIKNFEEARLIYKQALELDQSNESLKKKAYSE